MPKYTMWVSAQKDPASGWFLGALALVFIAMPILSLVVPPSSFIHLSVYGLTLIGKYLCYAVLALAIDLIWGYCGILSLGQAAFFSLGGYAMGMYLMRQIGTRGCMAIPCCLTSWYLLAGSRCRGFGMASTISGLPCRWW